MAGHSVRKADQIGQLSKISASQVSLAASTITVGGLQYDTSVLSCITSTAGAGGLDTGTIAASSKYYIYAVVSAGEVVLVCSLSDSAPSGFDSSTKVGFFWTDASANVDSINEKILLSGNAHGTTTKGATTTQYFLATTISNTISPELGTVSPNGTDLLFYTALKKQRVIFSVDAHSNGTNTIELQAATENTQSYGRASSVNNAASQSVTLVDILEVGQTIKVDGYNYNALAPGFWQLQAEEIE